jgi:hypothetical protein
MLSKSGVVCVLALGLLGNVTAASAFSPAQVHSALPATDGVIQASFFGRPYPYGYTGWARCTRYVEVQTPHGTYLRRVRLCR